MSVETATSQFSYWSTAPLCTAAYLTGPILEKCRELPGSRVLDLGCGNGALCGVLAEAGFDVTGCDASEEGIQLARTAYPQIQFQLRSVYDECADLGAEPFDLVVSTEVIEHLFLPRFLPKFAWHVLRPGGHLIVSTPYHGYLKNLALALSGKLDRHFTALWDGGHVKFWSRATLSQLVEEEGFSIKDFLGAGRVPYLWKSMLLVAKKAIR